MRTPLNHSVTIRISDDQQELVRNLSHRHNISFAEAIRVCIDHYVVLDAERTHRHQDIKKGEALIPTSQPPLQR